MGEAQRPGRGRRRRWLMLAVMLLIGVTMASLLAACGGGGTSPDAGQSGGFDYGKLKGQVRVDGSSTVFPISEAVAEEFSRVSDVRVNVAFSGTGGGFEKFCRGEIQISDASRAIKESERAACAKNGIDDIVEFEVAVDALTVVVNPRNTWATCLTPDQLRLLFKDGGAKKWSDVDPSWPDDNIQFFYPGADSGTFDYFDEAIIGEGERHRGDGTASEDDNILLKAVEDEKNGIAYFGFAYYQEAGNKLKAVAIDSGQGCVEPTVEAVLAGRYTPLSRPLFIYTRESLLAEQPEVLGFVKFYLENARTLVPEVGYVQIDEDILASQLARVEGFLAE